MYMNLVHDLDIFFSQIKDEIFFFYIENYEPKDLKKQLVYLICTEIAFDILIIKVGQYIDLDSLKMVTNNEHS